MDDLQTIITNVFSVIGAAITFASVVVKITPTQKDNAILEKIIKVFDTLSIFNPNGTTTIKTEQPKSKDGNK